MTKKEKIASLAQAMEKRERDGNEDDTYYCFTDDAAEELKDLFIEHNSIEDISYEIFSDACDLVEGVYLWKQDATKEEAEQYIYDNASDTASVYTSARLAYLTPYNEDEVSSVMREYGMRSIADACAAWYDREVEKMAILINTWINE